MKTLEVKKLVADAMTFVPVPYGADVIEDAFLAVERNQNLSSRYAHVCSIMPKSTVNQWFGRYVKYVTGINSLKQVDSERSKIVGSYTKLGH